MALKVTKQKCRFAEDCIFLPLCLFVHREEDQNDQNQALAQNYSFDKRAMLVETEEVVAETSQPCVQNTPQNLSVFPPINFSSKFTFFDGEDFLSEFDILMDTTTQGNYLQFCPHLNLIVISQLMRKYLRLHRGLSLQEIL